MEFLNNLLQSEAVLSAIALIVAAVWSAVKSSEWWRARKLDQYEAALGIVEIAVQNTYTNYVRDMKAKNGGKLREDSRGKALGLAIQQAVAIGQEHGIDVIAAVGSPRLLASEVQHAVNAAKRG